MDCQPAAKGKIILSKVAFISLIGALLDLEENRLELLDSYYPVPTPGRAEMDALIERYISRMNETLERITVTESAAANPFPFAVIGSQLVIQDLGNQAIEQYRIISPSKLRREPTDISIFSPLGKGVLLQEVNSIVPVDAPGGRFKFQIMSITINPQREG